MQYFRPLGLDSANISDQNSDPVACSAGNARFVRVTNIDATTAFVLQLDSGGNQFASFSVPAYTSIIIEKAPTDFLTESGGYVFILSVGIGGGTVLQYLSDATTVPATKVLSSDIGKATKVALFNSSNTDVVTVQVKTAAGADAYASFQLNPYETVVIEKGATDKIWSESAGASINANKVKVGG